MGDIAKMESLEQANDWLTKRLQLTEEQVREGEEVNIALTDENRQLKAVSDVHLGDSLARSFRFRENKSGLVGYRA